MRDPPLVEPVVLDVGRRLDGLRRPRRDDVLGVRGPLAHGHVVHGDVVAEFGDRNRVRLGVVDDEREFERRALVRGFAPLGSRLVDVQHGVGDDRRLRVYLAGLRGVERRQEVGVDAPGNLGRFEGPAERLRGDGAVHGEVGVLAVLDVRDPPLGDALVFERRPKRDCRGPLPDGDAFLLAGRHPNPVHLDAVVDGEPGEVR